jgi:hypothetical protein
MNVFKTWMVKVFLGIALLTGILGAFNIWMDPFWCFTHSHRFNSYQGSIDERQQKSNYLASRKPDYNAVILGASRDVQINQNDFKGVKAFNYAVSAMSPLEFKGYLEFFKTVAGWPDLIILGCNFSHTNDKLKPDAKAPEYYTSKASSLPYRLGSQFNFAMLAHSYKNLKLKYLVGGGGQKGQVAYYDRHNIGNLTTYKNPENRRNNRDRQVKDTAHLYREEYAYRESLKGLMTDIRDTNKGARILVYTTPVSEPYFCVMVKEGRLPEYERWLRDLVDVFGQVWHFEYAHSIARNYDATFCDAHHFYPWVGTLLAHRVSGDADRRIPADFGMLLNAANVDQRLAALRRDSLEICGK